MNDETILRLKNLPKPIADKLKVTSDRIRRILFLRGLFAVLSIALVTILGVMVIDAVTLLFSEGIRWLLTLTAFSVIGVAIYWHLVRPLARKLSLSDIARIIESRNENLQDERISSAVEILGREFKKGQEFSPVLLHQLVADAEKDADVVLPEQLFTLQSAKRFIIALGTIGFVYLIMFVVWPGTSSRLFVRAVAPFARVGGIFSDRLQVSPGDIRLAEGDSLTIKVELKTPTTTEVELRTKWSGQPEFIEQMQLSDPEGPQTEFTTAFPRVTENFNYRIRSGHAVTSFHRVEVFPRPEIIQLHTKVTPPDYTGMKPIIETRGPEALQILAGSTLEMDVETNIGLETAELFLGEHSKGKGTPEKREGLSLMRWTLPISPSVITVDWRVKMKSLDGFENQPVQSHTLTVLPDEAPEISIINPSGSEIELSSDGFLGLEYKIREQFGITRLELHVSIAGQQMKSIPQTVNAASNGSWSGRIPIYLETLDIGNATTVKLELVAFDNLPESYGGPNRGVSESLTVRIGQDAENLAHQEVMSQHERASAIFKESINDLEELSLKAEVMNEALRDIKESEAFEKADDIREELAKTEQKLRNLIEDLKGGNFKEIADSLDDVVENQLTAARNLGQELLLTDEASEQQKIGGELYGKIESALNMVKELDAWDDEIVEDALKLAEIEELTFQQDALVEEGKADDWEGNSEAWKARQEALAQELGALSAHVQVQQAFAENAQRAANEMTEAARLADDAVALAEDMELPAWMIAQDEALQAQLAALVAQEEVMPSQQTASNQEMKKMERLQQSATQTQQVVDQRQLDAQRAQIKALALMRSGASSEAIMAQEKSNQLQEDTKKIQSEANQQQGNAIRVREEVAGSEAPNLTEVNSQQANATTTQRRAHDAQQLALRGQEEALAASEPALDVAVSEAVTQQKAVAAAQQTAMEAQQAAEAALAAESAVAGAQQKASDAQAAAESAQEQAAVAQEAASQSQESAADSGNLEAMEVADAAQQTAREAQVSAEQLQSAASQAQQQAADLQQQAGLEEAAAAQSEAAETQQKAQSAQQAATEAQEQAAVAQEASAEAGSDEAAQAAKVAQTTANEAQQVATEAQQEAGRVQEQAEEIAASSTTDAQQKVSEAQQAATEAQAAAAEAQAEAASVAPSEAQSAASEVQQAAQTAQLAANEAQSDANVANAEAQSSVTAESQATAQAAQATATSAQAEATAAQQVASAAQPQSPSVESQSQAQQASVSAEAAADAAQAAADAGMPGTAEVLAELATSAQAAAAAMSQAAQQPGLPSTNQAMSDSAAQMAQIADAMVAAVSSHMPPSAVASSADMAAAAAQAAVASAAAAQATSQTQATQQAAAAAQQLQQMSEALAQSMGLPPPSESSSSQSRSSESAQGGVDNNAPNSEEMPTWVSDMGIGRTDWDRMRTLTNSGGVAVDDAAVPREYRQLVRDYFSELNNQDVKSR